MACFNQIFCHIRLNIKFHINAKIWHMLTEPKLPPPSCAQNVLSLLRRATGTDKKGYHPSLEAEIFLKCETVNHNRGIYLPVWINQASKSRASCKRSIAGNIWRLCTTTPLLSLGLSQSRSLLSLNVTILMRGRKLSKGAQTYVSTKICSHWHTSPQKSAAISFFHPLPENEPARDSWRSNWSNSPILIASMLLSHLNNSFFLLQHYTYFSPVVPCRHMEARTWGEPSRDFLAASHWSAQYLRPCDWSNTLVHKRTSHWWRTRGDRSRVWALLEAADNRSFAQGIKHFWSRKNVINQKFRPQQLTSIRKTLESVFTRIYSLQFDNVITKLNCTLKYRNEI